MIGGLHHPKLTPIQRQQLELLADCAAERGIEIRISEDGAEVCYIDKTKRKLLKTEPVSLFSQ